MALLIYGSSDDLVQVEGHFTEEYTDLDDDGLGRVALLFESPTEGSVCLRWEFQHGWTFLVEYRDDRGCLPFSVSGWDNQEGDPVVQIGYDDVVVRQIGFRDSW